MAATCSGADFKERPHGAGVGAFRVTVVPLEPRTGKADSRDDKLGKATLLVTAAKLTTGDRGGAAPDAPLVASPCGRCCEMDGPNASPVKLTMGSGGMKNSSLGSMR